MLNECAHGHIGSGVVWMIDKYLGKERKGCQESIGVVYALFTGKQIGENKENETLLKYTPRPQE